MHILDPETGESFINDDVSHPFVNDAEYEEYIQKFFSNSVIMNGLEIHVPMEKWLVEHDNIGLFNAFKFLDR